MLKIITTLVVGWLLVKVWRRQYRHELGGGEAVLWSVLWVGVLSAAWFPHATDVVARWVGVGRGADLLIFTSIVALFVLVSWLLARVERVEREITEIVRHEALRRGELGMKNKESGDRIDPAGPTP
ncbi:MAG: DUF2304 domain-containing protein [bacterium]|nr:DUF2304 domain-containing protein [bacterium]